MVFTHKAFNNVNTRVSLFEQFGIIYVANQHSKIALDECEPIN
jgi:hypothetical protein